MQARLGGTHVLPWAGYNDVSVLERHGDRKFHPVCISCLLHPSGHMMSRDGYRRIALLPTIDASSFPGSGLDDVKDAGCADRSSANVPLLLCSLLLHHAP